MNRRWIWTVLLSLLIATLVTAQDDDFEDFDKPEAGEASEAAAPPPGPSRDIESGDYAALGEAVKSGAEDRVVAAASRILAKDPNNVKALNGMAVFYIRTGKEDLAKILIDRALKTNENEPALHNNLGVIALKSGDLRKAIAYFRRSLEVSSGYKVGSTNLSSIFLQYRDYSRALSPLEESYRTLKSDVKKGNRQAVEVANNYAVALAGVNEAKKAQEVYQTILEGDSRSPEPMLNYAILLIEVLKDKREANRVLGKLKFITENGTILRKVDALEKRLETME